MIDSHCHLDHEPMFSDLKNVINRSKENGLEKILSICTTNDSFNKILEIVKFDPIIYGTLVFIHMKLIKIRLQKMRL